MADETNNQDISVFLEAIKQDFQKQLSQQREEMLKEFDKRENKIHSSYAKKMKTLQSEDAPEEEDAPTRKPTKRELELQDNIEKLLKRSEEAERKATIAQNKQNFTDALVKAGFKTEAVDAIYQLHASRNAFVQDDTGFKVKTSVDGMELTLPIQDAIKHYRNSTEAKLFLPASGNGSGTNANSSPNKPNSTPASEKSLEIDPAHPYRLAR